MEKIYTIGFSKQFAQTKIEFDFGNCVRVFFGENNGKIYAVVSEYGRNGVGTDCNGRHFRRDGSYDVYYRVNFKTREEGNRTFKYVKRKLGMVKWYEGCYTSNEKFTLEKIISVFKECTL